MIIEVRSVAGHSSPTSLVLIPNEEELAIIEKVLGKAVVNDDGLITLVGGRYKLSDGYGPAYLSLVPVQGDVPPWQSHKDTSEEWSVFDI